MKRDCSSCKKNNMQCEFGCPYLNPDTAVFYDFPYYGDPDFGVYGCPIYYKNENGEILRYYNDIDDGMIVKNELSYKGRIVYRTIKNFLELKKSYEDEKNNN